MRIGVIAPPWVPVPPRAYGGTEAVIDLLARGLASAGHEVTLFATGDSDCPVDRAFVVETAPGIDVGGSALELSHVAAAYERFEGYDIVHDHTIIGPLFAADRGLGPVVTTNHNPFAGRFAAALRALRGRIPIVAVSEHHASTARDIPVAAVIRHGIDADRLALGKGDGNYALFLGRMAEEKGAHRAVRVALEAGVRLLVAGKAQTAQEQAYLNDEVLPLLKAPSEFLGEVDYETKVSLLQHATCLINPILWPEPFGMVMIEALACGTPVIALAYGAAPEIVEDAKTGFLADSEEELVGALSRVDEIDREACRYAAEHQFAARRMVDEHVVFYERVIEEWSARGSRSA